MIPVFKKKKVNSKYLVTFPDNYFRKYNFDYVLKRERKKVKSMSFWEGYLHHSPKLYAGLITFLRPSFLQYQKLTCTLTGQAYGLHHHPRSWIPMKTHGSLWRLVLGCQYPQLSSQEFPGGNESLTSPLLHVMHFTNIPWRAQQPETRDIAL